MAACEDWLATGLDRDSDEPYARRILNAVSANWHDSVEAYQRLASAITRLMDLDLALIQDAYHTEAVAKYLRGERDLNEAIIGTTQSVVLIVSDTGVIERGNTFLSQLVCGQDRLPASVRTIDDLIPKKIARRFTNCSVALACLSRAGQ